MYGTVLDCPTATAYKLGDARRLVNTIQSVMNKFNVPLDKACEGCNSTVAEYESAKALLKKNEGLDFEN